MILERAAIAVIGAGVLSGAMIGGMLWFGLDVKDSVHLPKVQLEEGAPIAFALGTKGEMPVFSVPSMEGEFVFSASSPRPNGAAAEEMVLVIRLAKSGLAKKAVLPARVDLQYDEGGYLTFAEGKSSFWLELFSEGQGVAGRICLQMPQCEEVEVQRIASALQEAPACGAEAFAEGTPFRVLAEGKWRGTDLFREKYGDGVAVQCIEARGTGFELCAGQWLVWKEGKWQRSAELPMEKAPIARLEKVQGKRLILEGWEGDESVRVALDLDQGASCKVRGEELFHSIRIRSEKQISCMLEKQCLILRVGDWVCKGGSRWRVLRKKEDREALCQGECAGEVFVLDGIEIKQGQKAARGSFFNAARSQMIPIELPASSNRKGQS